LEFEKKKKHLMYALVDVDDFMKQYELSKIPAATMSSRLGSWVRSAFIHLAFCMCTQIQYAQQ
jgi:hypothetical protein